MAATDNLGPMPTPATLPPRCRIPVVSGACTSADCTGSRGLACAGTTATPDAGCWPAATASSSSADAGPRGYGGRGYYSPAVACPVDYATAGGTATIIDADDDDVTVYRVYCCPSGYSRVRAEAGERVCQTQVSATTYSATLCGGDGDGDGAPARGTTIGLPLTATDAFWGETWTVTAQTLRAPAVEIRFQETDLVRANTPPTAPPDPADPAEGLPPPPPAAALLPHSLSRDAEIGLGVGIPLAGIAVVGLAWVWYKRGGSK